jgi:tetratricopeptide (TPR) repeat protein
MSNIRTLVATLLLLGIAAGAASAETPEEAIIQECTQALAANPRDAEAYGRRGAAYIKSKAYDKALPDFTEALKLDAQNGTFFCGRGDCHRMLGMHELAVADYTAAIKYNDLHPHFFGMRGNCYMALGKRKEAIADMERALELGHPSVDYFKSCIAKMQAELNAAKSGASGDGK